MLASTRSEKENGPRTDLIYLYWWSYFTPKQAADDLRRNGIKATPKDVKRRYDWFRRQGRTQCDKYALLEISISILEQHTNGLAASTLTTPLGEQPVLQYSYVDPRSSYNENNPDGFK